MSAKKNACDRRKKQLVKVLGVKEQDFKSDLTRLKDGKPGEAIRRHCYLCGIRRGEKSVAVNVSESEPKICTPEAKFYRILRKVGEFTFEYDLCFHCSLLLDASKEAITDNMRRHQRATATS